MNRKILITGATGMIGSALLPVLSSLNTDIVVLSTDPSKVKKYKAYLWNVHTYEIDLEALNGVDTIIHLAGAPIVEKRWTIKRKKELIDSRVQSTNLLLDAIIKTGNHVKTLISASAVGFYGDRSEEILTEESVKGKGFTADCCNLWEQAISSGNKLNLRTVKIRTGFVLSKKKGSLPLMALPVKLGLSSAYGDGNQWMPWIHEDDLVNIYIKACFDEEMKGVFNGCAPIPERNKDFIKKLSKVLNRPFWNLKIPKSILKLLMGERSELLLMSNHTNVNKLLATGFTFKFTELEPALVEIYG